MQKAKDPDNGIYKGQMDYLFDAPEVYDANHPSLQAVARAPGVPPRAAITAQRFAADQQKLYRILLGLLNHENTYCNFAITNSYPEENFSTLWKNLKSAYEGIGSAYSDSARRRFIQLECNRKSEIMTFLANFQECVRTIDDYAQNNNAPVMSSAEKLANLRRAVHEEIREN